MRILGCLSILVAAIDCWIPQAAMAQATISLDPTPACSSCRIELVHVATLGEDDGEGFVNATGVLLRDGQGRFLMVDPTRLNSIQVFGNDGRYLRTVGRSGGGPGEFSFIVSMRLGPGDSIHVAELRNMRVSVLTPQYEFARSYRIPAFPKESGLLPLAKGAVLNSTIQTPERVGLQECPVTS